MTVCEQAQGIVYRNHRFQYMIKASCIQSVCELFTMAGKRIRLTPRHYVGIEEEEDDGIPFEERMENLTNRLYEQFRKSTQLKIEIRSNLKNLGYDE